MNGKSLAVALAAAALSGTALAENDIWSMSTLDPTLTNQFANFGPAKSFGGAFYDVFAFSLSSPPPTNVGNAVGVHVQLDSSTPDLTFDQVKLNGVLGTVLNVGTQSFFWTVPVSGVGSNNPAFNLEVWGNADAGAQYGG